MQTVCKTCSVYLSIEIEMHCKRGGMKGGKMGGREVKAAKWSHLAAVAFKSTDVCGTCDSCTNNWQLNETATFRQRGQ